MYRKIFSKAKKRETLDAMVRRQARDLGVAYSGNDTYFQHAVFSTNEPKAFAMFNAALLRLNRIKELEIETLCPSDLFE